MIVEIYACMTIHKGLPQWPSYQPLPQKKTDLHTWALRVWGALFQMLHCTRAGPPQPSPPLIEALHHTTEPRGRSTITQRRLSQNASNTLESYNQSTTPGIHLSFKWDVTSRFLSGNWCRGHNMNGFSPQGMSLTNSLFLHLVSVSHICVGNQQLPSTHIIISSHTHTSITFWNQYFYTNIKPKESWHLLYKESKRS